MSESAVRLGLRENIGQFTLLVVVNAFVGGMVGLERSILPQIAEAEFAIAAKTALFSFIVVFGFVKAFTNYFTGALANRFGRRNLLILGWLFGLPVPLILMYAPSWNWIIAANVLLGINQGLAWSSTVVMKIGLIGERNRGLAMGLNEFAGYISVGAIAFVTGWVAGEYGLRPYPFYIGIAMAAVGLAMSIFLIRDTRHHVARESQTSQTAKLRSIFWDTTIRDRNLGSITQAGLVNNLNDGMVWGLLPVILAVKQFSLSEIGAITAIYPAVWGFGQLFTGKMADHFDKKTYALRRDADPGHCASRNAFCRDDGRFRRPRIRSRLGHGNGLPYISCRHCRDNASRGPPQKRRGISALARPWLCLRRHPDRDRRRCLWPLGLRCRNRHPHNSLRRRSPGPDETPAAGCRLTKKHLGHRHTSTACGKCLSANGRRIIGGGM